MAKKEINILNEQIQKLETKGFDLESWKILTINILERIFGASSAKIEQVKELKYDFSSWSLRDTSGSTGSINKRAKVILESAINELESFGLPDISPRQNENENSSILLAFEDELKGTQFKRLKDILSVQDRDERKKQLKEFLDLLDNDVKDSLLLSIISKI